MHFTHHGAHTHTPPRSRRINKLASVFYEPESPAAGRLIELSASEIHAASPTWAAGGVEPRTVRGGASARRAEEETAVCTPPGGTGRPRHRASKATPQEATTSVEKLLVGDLPDRCDEACMCMADYLCGTGWRPKSGAGTADWPAQAAGEETPDFDGDALTAQARSPGDRPAPAVERKCSTTRARQDDFMCSQEDLAFARGCYSSAHPVVSFVDLPRALHALPVED
jgi:hypothetical protein